MTQYDPGEYDRKYRNLEQKRYLRYLLGRMSCGRINPPYRESFPYYDQWFRRWPAVRGYFYDILLSKQAMEGGLWNRSGIMRLLHDLSIGRNVWDAIGTILLIEVLLRQLVNQTDRPGNVLKPSVLLGEV